MKRKIKTIRVAQTRLCSRRQGGFYIIETLVVLLIVGILTVTLTPNLTNYTNKSKFVDVIAAAEGLKSSVGGCIYSLGTVTGCSAGTNGIPVNVASGYGGYTQSTSVLNGVIQSTAVSSIGGDTYILTPTVLASGATIWTVSGTCLTSGYCIGNTGSSAPPPPSYNVWPVAEPSIQFASATDFMNAMLGHSLAEMTFNSNIVFNNNPSQESNYTYGNAYGYSPRGILFIILIKPDHSWGYYEVFSDAAKTQSIINTGQPIQGYTLCTDCA